MEFQEGVKEGDVVDALKIDYENQSICWSKATVKEVTDELFKVQFHNSFDSMDRDIEKGTFDIAALETHCRDFPWR